MTATEPQGVVPSSPPMAIDATAMGALVRTLDWSTTSLGPRRFWPKSLSNAVDLLLNSPLPMVLMWGPDHAMIYNDGYIPIAGSRHPDALGRNVSECWPEIWSWNKAVLERGFQGEALTYRHQHLAIARNGQFEDAWFDLYYTPVRGDEDAVAGVLCTVFETTTQVAALRRLDESERRLIQTEASLSLLVNQASIGITRSDLAGNLVAANERFCSLVGRSAPDVLGHAIEELLHPDDWDGNRALLVQMLKTGKPFAAEGRFLRPDGSVVWVSNHVSLAHDPEGRPAFVIRITHDISDRKVAEASAQDSSERAQLALGTGVVLGTWIIGTRNGVIRGDARFARTFSLDPNRVALGVPLETALGAVHPDDRASADAAIRDTLRHGGPYRAEYRVRQLDSTWLWVEANGHCEIDEAGTLRFPGVLINIDQRRKAAERQAFLIALGDQLRTIEDPGLIIVRTAEATAHHLHALRVGYGEVSSDGRTIDVLGGWAAGAAPLAGPVTSTLFGAPTMARLQAGEASLVRRVAEEQDATAIDGDHAVVAVPLLREGRWHAVMFATDAARSWTKDEADLLREVIGRTWEAVERARAVVTLRKAQARQAFLLRLNDHLSEIDDPHDVMSTVAESLGSYLHVSRASYGEAVLDDKTIVFDGNWTDGTVPSLNGPFVYEGIAEEEIAQLMRGLTVSHDDFAVRPGKSAELETALADRGTRAALAVPLIRDGQLRAGLFLSQSTPRRWSLEEISLTQEVARRTWDALERTRAEQALQRSEARLRAMFATLPVGIVFAEMPSGRVTEGNARVEEILGYPAVLPNLHAGYDEWVAFDEDGTRVPVEQHPLYLAVTTGEMAVGVFHHERGDGTHIWVRVIGAPVRDGDGRITGGLVTIVDIDREKRAEAALRDLNTNLEHQIELRTRERDRVWRNSQDLLAVIGIDGVLHALNPSWTPLLGWDIEELVGRRFDTFVHPDDVVPTFQAMESLRHGPLAAPFENRYRKKNGEYRWFSWTASFEDEAVYASGRDVTEQKHQADALRQAEEQLRQSQKMEAVGQLTGGIAHDFNNLLTGITGALDLLSKRIEQGRLENTGRYIGMAMNSANRAAALTHRLLAFSRRQPLEAKAVDTNRLVTSMDDLLRRTLGEKITLEMVVAGGLWLTLCDPHQLENALLNLAINARDAMPDGGRLTVETSNAILDDAYAKREIGIKPGQYVMLSVSDTGAGMGADVIARAFDPFFTTKPIGQGTGLGLSMIYGFAKQSEGTVKIYSELGLGTTVKLYLPRSQGELIEKGEDHGEVPRARAGETVMIVEDDATVRELVLEVLRELGYHALQAHDGPSGLDLLRSSEHVDLLVTDVGLPGLNGRQLADQARETRPWLKVLFITGYAENATFGNGHLNPGMQMITKPFAVETLATKIKEMIEAS